MDFPYKLSNFCPASTFRLSNLNHQFFQGWVITPTHYSNISLEETMYLSYQLQEKLLQYQDLNFSVIIGTIALKINTIHF